MKTVYICELRNITIYMKIYVIRMKSSRLLHCYFQDLNQSNFKLFENQHKLFCNMAIRTFDNVMLFLVFFLELTHSTFGKVNVIQAICIIFSVLIVQ